MGQSRIIKKYPNRRLYDTEVSSYITLEDVRRLITERVDFQVVDARSGRDITRGVMLQIIAEYEDRGDPIFSTELLSELIRFYGDAMQGVMGRYLERSLSVFMDQQQQFRQQLNEMVSQTSANWLKDAERTEPAPDDDSSPDAGGKRRLRAVDGKSGASD